MSSLLRAAGGAGFRPFNWSSPAQFAAAGVKMMAEPLCYINGEWVSNPTKLSDSIAVEDPCTNEAIGSIPNFGREETELAIAAAQKGFEQWRQVMPRERARAVRRWADLMLQHKEALGNILSRESGKVIAEGKGEIEYAEGFVEWFAGEAERIYGDVIPGPRPGVQTTVLKEPIGVVGIITPWNFPAAMITRGASAAIAAGCSVVVKPARQTPFTALALAQLADEAGIPPGVFNVVTGNVQEISDTLMSSFEVRKISFTGSTQVGKSLYAQSAATMKKVTMELGGNAPFLVFESADLDRAADGLIAAKFRNAGQTCICCNRALVQASIFDRFRDLVVAKVCKMKVGNNFDSTVTTGALIDAKAVAHMEAIVEDAVQHGARVEVGGKRVAGPGNFFEPTVLTNVNHGSMVCCQEEIFGPILPLVKFDTEDDGVRMANDTRAGLASYFFSNDYRQQHRVCRSLRYGMVGVNDNGLSAPCAPFGGVKDSGLGRDGSKYGIEPYVDIKYVLFSTV